MSSLWIARDKDGELSLYAMKPERKQNEFESDWYIITLAHENVATFPEVTWENSPKELIIKENDNETI